MQQLAGSPHKLVPACQHRSTSNKAAKFVRSLKLMQWWHKILGAPCQNQKQEQLMSSETYGYAMYWAFKMKYN